MARFSFLAALVALCGQAHAVEQHLSLNPIRKVVTLLQSMQSKVQEEGAREAELYKKFMCYCKNGDGELTGSIAAAEDKIEALTSEIEASTAKLSGAKSTLKQAQNDRDAANTAMSQATAQREKEASEYAKFKSDSDTNILAIHNAVEALSKGVAGSFLQSPAAQVLKKVVSKSDMMEPDQEVITAFLSQSAAYAPQSGQIIGILKGMSDTMGGSLTEATNTENAAIETYEGLMAAKKREVAALTSTIETKLAQVGELSVSIATAEEDLTDTKEALGEDQQFLLGLKKSCATKTAEWEERSKTRAEELVALADTIKVLNDDDALELFKKTLPSASASLLQVGSGQRSSAVKSLRSALSKAPVQDKPALDLLLLAMAGKAGGDFSKVIGMIDKMVSNLGQEQKDDDAKKHYCNTEFDTADDQKKELEHSLAAEEAAIAKATETISSLTQEIATLTAGIKALDESVAAATQQRKDENAEYKSLIASNTAAIGVLDFAKNRLNKFYNPKLYKAPAKAELSSEDRTLSNMGNPQGLVTTAAPGGIANTGVTVLAQVSMHKQREAPAPPPATWDVYASKSQENTGVISMIDLLVKDLTKEMTVAETDEKNAQEEYEQLMVDSAAKRKADSKSLSARTSAKSDTEAALQDHKEGHADATAEHMATMKKIAALHGECDWLLEYFEARKAARAGEVESLQQAKAVLSGADYSLVQRGARTFLGRTA